MPDPAKPVLPVVRVVDPRKPVDTEKVLCDRCQAEMFRMHAVWRCPSCGFKTDCCGW